MARTRRVLVVAFVATALAADRVGWAAPVLCPNNMAAAARQLAGRLAVGFQRSVAAARVEPYRRDERPARVAVRPVLAAGWLRIRVFEFSPIQFRLPPPVL